MTLNPRPHSLFRHPGTHLEGARAGMAQVICPVITMQLHNKNEQKISDTPNPIVPDLTALDHIITFPGQAKQKQKCCSLVEMQSSGPAARPDPKFSPGRTFCGARITSAGLMPGSGEAITKYYALAAGLRTVLDRSWPVSMLVSGDFVRCRSGFGLDFWRNFGTSSN